jgi:DNA-binding MarR family transcriptional regulator
MVSKQSKIKVKNSVQAADNFMIEASRLVAAIVKGDTDEIGHLIEDYQEFSTNQLEDSNLPIDPWKDPSVLYGAYLALAEVAEHAGRTVVPHNVMKELLNSQEAHRILLKISEEPGGLIEKSKIPELTYIHRSNAHQTIQKLTKLGLLRKYKVNRNSKKWTLELTIDGWSAVALMRAWNIEPPKLKPPIVILVRTQTSIPNLAKNILERTIALGANKCGQEIGTVIDNTNVTTRRRLCKAVRNNINELEPREALEFLSGILQGRKPDYHPRDLYRKFATISQTRARELSVNPIEKVRKEILGILEYKEKEAENFQGVYSQLFQSTSA